MIEQAELTWFDGIQASVTAAIAARRPDSFGGLLKLIPGLPPDPALRALHQLRTLGLFDGEVDALVISATSPVAHLEDPIDTVLLRPHPLDYEWRFDRATRSRLSKELGTIAGSTGHVVALGCPTVTYELLRSDPRVHATLIDANPGLPVLSRSPWYRQLSANLLEGTPEKVPTADVVIADPPFYAQHIEAFLIAASAVMRTGSLLFICLPSETTRPTAKEDVAAAIARAQSVSLRWQGVRSGGVKYLRPRFERLAHEAKGLLGVPDDWRVADLHIFERTDSEPSTHHPLHGADIKWVEVVIGSSRIRIRIDGARERHDPTEVPLLGEIIPGDVLDSVSGRDPRRGLANVWTDGNVVWHTHQPTLVLAILQAVSAGGDPYEAARGFCTNEGFVVVPDHLVSAVTRVVEKVKLLT
jgi:hypothetical protein